MVFLTKGMVKEMFCHNCGAKIHDGIKFCTNCGYSADEKEQQSRQIQSIPQPAPSVEYRYLIPDENRPVSPWIIALLTMLYSIPLVGFVACLVFSFNDNVNIRNHARSIWCFALIGLVLFITFLIIGGVTGTTDQLMDILESLHIIEY